MSERGRNDPLSLTLGNVGFAIPVLTAVFVFLGQVAINRLLESLGANYRDIGLQLADLLTVSLVFVISLLGLFVSAAWLGHNLNYARDKWLSAVIGPLGAAECGYFVLGSGPFFAAVLAAAWLGGSLFAVKRRAVQLAALWGVSACLVGYLAIPREHDPLEPRVGSAAPFPISLVTNIQAARVTFLDGESRVADLEGPGVWYLGTSEGTHALSQGSHGKAWRVAAETVVITFGC